MSQVLNKIFHKAQGKVIILIFVIRAIFKSISGKRYIMYVRSVYVYDLGRWASLAQHLNSYPSEEGRRKLSSLTL